MNLFQELFLTASFTFFFSLLIAKLVSLATAGTGDGGLQSSEVTEGTGFGAAKRGIESDMRVQLPDGDVAVEKRCGGAKLDGFGDVEGESAKAGVSGEKIVASLVVDDEVVDEVGGVSDYFRSSRAVSENVENVGVLGDIMVNLVSYPSLEGDNGKVVTFSEEISVDDVEVERSGEGGRQGDEFKDMDKRNVMAGVPVEKTDDRLTAEDKTVDNVGFDNDNLENSGTIEEDVEITGDEGDIRIELVRNDRVVNQRNVLVGPVDDVFESSGASDENYESVGVGVDITVNLGRNDSVANEENAMAEVSKVKVVELVGVECPGAIDEIVESARTESDNMVNLETNDPVVNYNVPVEENSEGGKSEEFEEKNVEHVGVDDYSFKNPGANIESVENAAVAGDIMVNLGSCDKDNIGKLKDEKMKVFVDDEDDDWEGIERSELEENFVAAANYVSSVDKNDGKSELGSDVKMELYGLNKVVLEGPCREPQPMAIKVSARAKWNAWQRLGNMSPEDAMEQYISLLSDNSPEWMLIKSSQGDGSKDSSSVSDLGTYRENPLSPTKERVVEPNSTTNEVI